MNEIKLDEERNRSVGFGNPYYIYKFSAPWGLEDDSEQNLFTPDHNYQKIVFESILKEFIVRLRRNIYKENFEDLFRLQIDRLSNSTPLKDGEKMSVLIELEEREELKKLKKKYEQ